MSFGYLSITTRLADGASPIEGAKIYIAPSSGNGIQNSNSVVSDTFYSYYFTTDSSGNTGFIRIDTPDAALSENPNRAGANGFMILRRALLYNISAMKSPLW